MLLGKLINFSIDQDSSKIDSAYQFFLNKIKKGEYDTFFENQKGVKGEKWKFGYDGPDYNWTPTSTSKQFNKSRSYAHVMFANEHSDSLVCLFGDVITKICPWTVKFLDLVKDDLNPAESGSMFMEDDVIPHIDRPGDDQPVVRLLTVLYAEDPDSHTIVWDGTIDDVDRLRKDETYRKELPHEIFYLKPGDTLLLDVKRPHAVVNKGKRLQVSTAFDNTIEEVATFFETFDNNIDLR